MRALNASTEVIIRRFKERILEDVTAGKPNPLSELNKKKHELHPDAAPGEWPETARTEATEALEMWTVVQLAGMLTCVVKELNDVGSACIGTTDPKIIAALRELATSMGFIETVFKTWFDTVDVAAVADALFEAAVEVEKNPPQPKKEKKKTASSLIDELLAKYKPSNN